MPRPMPLPIRLLLALPLVVAACERTGQVDPAGDPFADASLERGANFGCPAGATCTGAGEIYSSAYRLGVSPTSRGDLTQTFTATSHAAPVAVTVALRQLRPFTLPPGANAPLLQAEVRAAPDSGSPEVATAASFATGSVELLPAAAAGSVRIPLVASGALEIGARYQVFLHVDALPVETEIGMFGVGAFINDTYGSAGAAFRRSLRRLDPGASFNPSRFRPAGAWQLALALEVEACSPRSTVCPLPCAESAECASGKYCEASACVPTKAAGATCAAAAECGTGFCADGVCCNVACGEACLACGSGTCAPVAVNTADPLCGELACNGAGACRTTCASSAECAPGRSCFEGACVTTVPNGATCQGDAQCQSGFCVSGVCCNVACTGSATACTGAPTCSTGTCVVPNVPAGTDCTSDGNPCTSDVCDGAGTCAHPAGNAGVTCRSSSAICDVAEVCTGSSTSCPADAFVAPGTVCRAAGGLCDAAEACTGGSAACPGDVKVAAGTVCRPRAALSCDVAETCDGSSLGCPADVNPVCTSCKAASLAGSTTSGVHTVQPAGAPASFQVWCDQQTAPGGWTVIQRRADATDFYRNWASYKAGFGTVGANTSYWIGLDRMNQLAPPAAPLTLRVNLTPYAAAGVGGMRYATWAGVSFGPESDYYRLTVGAFTEGTGIGNSLTYHSGRQFSTIDVDRDANGGSCAVTYRGAWWYGSCHESNLNGLYFPSPGTHASYADGADWYGWLGHYQTYERVEMMVR